MCSSKSAKVIKSRRYEEKCLFDHFVLILLNIAVELLTQTSTYKSIIIIIPIGADILLV